MNFRKVIQLLLYACTTTLLVQLEVQRNWFDCANYDLKNKKKYNNKNTKYYHIRSRRLHTITRLKFLNLQF
jgi:hypothetical protein